MASNGVLYELDAIDIYGFSRIGDSSGNLIQESRNATLL